LRLGFTHGLGDNQKMRIWWIAVCAALGGCTSSTGILPAGPDTYTISERFAPIPGGGVEAQRDVLTKANDFCAQQGRQFVPVIMGRSGDPIGYGVTFKCLLPNDPAAAKLQIQQTPNVIVEQRTR
jgi:hypothetical protein